MELEPCCIYLKFCTQKFHNFFMYCVVNRTVVELLEPYIVNLSVILLIVTALADLIFFLRSNET